MVLRPCAALLGVFLLLAIPALAFDPAEQMQFANGLYARGLYDMAIREYLTVAREASDYSEIDSALYRVAESYRHLGNRGAADRFYQRLIKEHPNSAFRHRAQFRRAEQSVSGNKYLDAVNLFRALLADGPQDDIAASAQYYLGYALKRLQVEEDAEAAFNVVLKEYVNSPFHSFACLELADLYRGGGKKTKTVEKLYRKVFENPATPRVGAEALFQLAGLKYKAASYRDSSVLYEQLLETYPEDQRAVEAQLQAAWSYLRSDDPKKALLLADQALSADAVKARADWLYLKANAERQLNHPKAALAAYDGIAGSGVEKDFIQAAMYESALVEYKQKQFQAVLDRLAGFEGEAKLQADAAWLRGEARAALGERDKAIKEYQRILDEHPKEAAAPKAAYQVGRLLQDEKKWEEAVAAYQYLVEQYPKDDLAPAALFAEAHCLSRLGKHKKAVERWSRLVQEYKKDEFAEEALFRKALGEVQMGQKKKPAQSLNRFLEQYPGSRFVAKAHYWQGVLSDEAGHHKKAEASLRKALDGKLFPDLANRVRYRLASVLLKQDRKGEAADLIQPLITTREGREMPPALLEWLAGYRLEQEAYTQARDASQALVTHAQQPVWKQIGYYLEGLAWLEEKRMKEAMAVLKRAVDESAISREGAEAALLLGTLYVAERNHKEARRALAKAAEWASEPDMADIRARSYYQIADSFAEEKNWDKAARYFLSVSILFDDPDLTPECLFRAAEALAKQGKSAEQQARLAELKDRYPDSPWASNEGKPRRTRRLR